jgi:hypothetical protein
MYIYSFKFPEDRESCQKPIHVSTMVNFVNCTTMYFGESGYKCIVFQVGFPNVTIYQRKYQHNFLENIENDSRECVNCVNLPKFNSFIVSDDDCIEIFCGGCFGKQHKMQLELDQKDKDKTLEILSIRISRDQQLLAVMVGYILIREIEEVKQIYVYKINSKTNFE